MLDCITAIFEVQQFAGLYDIQLIWEQGELVGCEKIEICKY